MMPKTKLIIFDIDGTLIDSVKGYHEVICKAMNALGILKVDTNFDALTHHTDSFALKYNYENFFKQPMPKSLLDQFETQIVYYLKLQKQQTKAIKGAKNMLESLSNSGFAIAFATGSLPAAAIYKMQQANLPINPQVLTTSKTSFTRDGFVQEAITQAKNFYKIADFEQIIAVGDGVWDLQTAQNLKLEFIGIGTKHKKAMLANGMQHWHENFETFTVPTLKLS